MKTETMVLMWASLALIAGGIISAVMAGQIDCGLPSSVECEAAVKRAWQLPVVVIALGVGLGLAAGSSAIERPSDRAPGSTPGAP